MLKIVANNFTKIIINLDISQILILDFKRPLGGIMVNGSQKGLALKSADKATKNLKFTGFGVFLQTLGFIHLLKN